MEISTDVIVDLKSSLRFHRIMVVVYFLTVMFVSVSFIGIEVISHVKSYEIAQAFTTAFSKFEKMPDTITVRIAGADKKSTSMLGEYLKDMDGAEADVSQSVDEYLKSINHFLTASAPSLIVSVFVVFAAFGMIRHHLRRINATEDRIFHLSVANYLDKQGVGASDRSIILKFFLSNNSSGDVSEPAMHPVVDAVERLTRSLSILNKRAHEAYNGFRGGERRRRRRGGH